MTYEITTPGRNCRTCMNVTADTLAEARKIAAQLAKRDDKPMMIERVTSRGISTHVETVR